MFQFEFLWLMDLLLIAGTNGLRFHHSSTSESTSAAQVNLPLLINGKHAEKQNHAIFLNPFAVLFLYTVCYSLIKLKRCRKISSRFLLTFLILWFSNPALAYFDS